MYKYETHLHSSPVSVCAKAGVRENLEFYKSLGYDGVFLTNHFLDGNIGVDTSLDYKQKLDYYFSDYHEAKKIGKEIKIKVFLGLEISYKGTDFLIYGLDEEWYYAHPEIMEMKKTDELDFMIKEGAYVVQAHPYREANYINHVRLFPRSVHAVEIYNACRKPLENKMAKIYAKEYNLATFAGTDNHFGAKQKFLGGMQSKKPVTSEKDFVTKLLNGEMKIFKLKNKI